MNKTIDFLGDGTNKKDATPRYWNERRFKVACAVLPEMARQAFEEGLDMDDAVDDAIRYADLLIAKLS